MCVCVNISEPGLDLVITFNSRVCLRRSGGLASTGVYSRLFCLFEGFNKVVIASHMLPLFTHSSASGP